MSLLLLFPSAGGGGGLSIPVAMRSYRARRLVLLITLLFLWFVN